MSTRTGTRSRGNDPTTVQLMLLEYNGRQTIVPRPQGYQAFLHSIRRYLPDIPKEHDDFEFETNELPIAVGKWVVISEDAWETVVPLVQTIKVVSSACTKSSGKISAPQASESATRVKRRREDSDPYHVLIRTLTGRTMRISCSRSDTVGKLKERVQDRDGTLPEDQRLIYAGKQLDNDQTLAACNIHSAATIHLVPRQRGGKPVIYLYPPTATRVSTKLSLVPEWEFSAIYPVVHAKATPEGQELEWVVDAAPNGTLKEVETGLEASYLYWEAETNAHGLLSPPASPSLARSGTTAAETFVPNRATLNTKNSVLLEVEKITPYLDSALMALGLHVEARTSFITYWLPSILKHKHVALRFLPQSAYERAAPLRLDPAPDVVARIFMLFRGVDEENLELWDEARERTNDAVEFWKKVVGIDVDKLQDASLFRVIEWGGMEVR